MSADKKIEMGLLSLRVPVSTLETLDDMAYEMEQENPGVRVTRAEVARMLLLSGLSLHNKAKEAADARGQGQGVAGAGQGDAAGALPSDVPGA